MIDNIMQLVQQHKAYQPLLQVKSKLTGFLVGMAIPVLIRIVNRPTWDLKVSALRKLPSGSLGKDIANKLDKNGFDLIPKFENHDAQHILLDYEMTGLGEIRLQFFLLGNGHKTLLSIASAVLGILVFPELYKTFHADYERGKNTKEVAKIDFQKKLGQSTLKLKNELFH